MEGWQQFLMKTFDSEHSEHSKIIQPQGGGRKTNLTIPFSRTKIMLFVEDKQGQDSKRRRTPPIVPITQELPELLPLNLQPHQSP
ncbi:MAG: hypothetical protein EZS28_050691 [Streblomastix strix]|uniref:Uncharacterized protein n=1 Tax=Streblomastix strix TaxID=222440 RepID=A0A5J4T727_9EUKA|nr:MAG: hypothetical protein EZS28_050691 [Streblomastix strix]